MFGSVVLDVAIGMAFVYLLLSLIASVVQEIIASYLQLRSANLLRGIRSLFSGYGLPGIEDMADALYSHGLIRGLYYDPCDEVRRLKAKAVAVKATGAADAVFVAKAVNLEQEIAGAAKVTFGVLLQGFLRKLAGFEEQPTLTVVSKSATLPSYIPSRTFATAMIDILSGLAPKDGRETAAAMAQAIGAHSAPPAVEGTPNPTPTLTPNVAAAAAVAKASAEVMAKIIEALEKDELGAGANKAAQALHALAVDAKGDLTKFQKNLENWFNDSMDRASGWYKKYIQRILLALGLVLAMFLNVDSVRVARTLWFDRDAREQMANAASAYMQRHPDAPKAVGVPAEGGKGEDPSSDARALQAKLQESADTFNEVTRTTLLPVGWKRTPLAYVRLGWKYVCSSDWSKTGPWWKAMNTVWRMLTLIAGWALTATAISLGAPFWFDMLNKFMVVRSTIKPQEKSQTEGSKD